MSIQLEIPFEALARPGVARALADLVVSLGGHADLSQGLSAVVPAAPAPQAEAPKAAAPKAEAPKAEAPKAEAPKAEAPKPVATPAPSAPTPAPAKAPRAASEKARARAEAAREAIDRARSKASKASKGSGKASTKAAAKPAAPAAAPPKAASAPVDASYAERWQAYITALPASSARFLELLEEHGRLTVNEAIELLDLKTPKAMGGLTGAMRRWAPKQDIVLPFEAQKTADNDRCWVWTGHPK